MALRMAGMAIGHLPFEADARGRIELFLAGGAGQAVRMIDLVPSFGARTSEDLTASGALFCVCDFVVTRQAVRHVLVLVETLIEARFAASAFEATEVPIVAIDFGDLTLQGLLAARAGRNSFHVTGRIPRGRGTACVAKAIGTGRAIGAIIQLDVVAVGEALVAIGAIQALGVPGLVESG